MSRKLSIYYFISICMSSMFFSCETSKTIVQYNLPHNNPLIGSWEINSVHWISKDTTYTIEKAQPGILMIDPLRYALIWTPTEAPRVPFKELSNPTDDELKAGFRSIVFNTGSYEVTDSTLTTKAVIAKVPGFEGGRQFYRYKLDDNRMEITMFDETYPNGDKPNWYGTFETKFVMSRVK